MKTIATFILAIVLTGCHAPVRDHRTEITITPLKGGQYKVVTKRFEDGTLVSAPAVTTNINETANVRVDGKNGGSEVVEIHVDGQMIEKDKARAKKKAQKDRERKGRNAKKRAKKERGKNEKAEKKAKKERAKRQRGKNKRNPNKKRRQPERF